MVFALRLRARGSMLMNTAVSKLSCPVASLAYICSANRCSLYSTRERVMWAKPAASGHRPLTGQHLATIGRCLRAGAGRRA